LGAPQSYFEHCGEEKRREKRREEKRREYVALAVQA
jgi:hypothetical protein